MRLVILLFILSTLTLTGCSPKSVKIPISAPEQSAPYPDLGVAPELYNDTWINTSEPLRLAGLRGKVILIDMWTFG